MRVYDTVGIAAAEILLPRAGTDLSKWAVVACDQFTSEPEYWTQVEQLVGDHPSTLRLIYPEVYLGEDDPDARIQRIRAAMTEYLDEGVLTPHEGLIYVEREIAGKTRRGLVLCVDLERYDFRRGSSSLIRATEGTIIERLPPRIRIREGAPLELPHIMVLIDDPDESVIGPVGALRSELTKLYDFELMMDSGQLRGFSVPEGDVEAGVVTALEALAEPASFRAKYGFDADRPVLLYAMGDGNHSLATAKAIWEQLKERAGAETSGRGQTRRYALVELVNVHDAALEFEPIHRVLFDVAKGRDVRHEMERHFGPRFDYQSVASLDEMKQRVEADEPGAHRMGIVTSTGYGVMQVRRPETNLAVGTLQEFLDTFLEDGGATEIDYVHGTSTVETLGRMPGNIGFCLPAMDKQDLFKSVIVDGALPRKTFSMGEAKEKRFYMECRELS